MRLEPENAASPRRRLTSSNDDVDLEVVPLGYSIVEREVATLCVVDVVRHQLRLPLRLPVWVIVRVVLGRDDDTGLVGRKVRDNIAPTLVVVDAQRDDEALLSVGRETKGATRSTAAHREHMGAVDVAPRSTVGVLPDRPLDDAEERVLVGLIDLRGNGVTHSRTNR